MWPQTLQISDDECRSTLRRLELDTYANVMGTFRAQGGLSERKSKLLEELRSIFHISQDRHRAESRRVANDELLSTIARAVSGPNTWQEWSREGRRSYSMLPRVAPQTALGWIANNLATEAAIENSKLPYPTETAIAVEEQATMLGACDISANSKLAEKFVVKSDPFKMPDIPLSGSRKNLKRGIVDGYHPTGSSSTKKRNVNDISLGNNKQKHVTANSNSTAHGRKVVSLTKFQEQQRYFYIQQQKSKKHTKAAIKQREKLSGTGRSGRKSKRMKDLQQKLDEDQTQQIDMNHTYQSQNVAFPDYQTTSNELQHFVTDNSQQQNLHDQQEEHFDGINEVKDLQIGNTSRVAYSPLKMTQAAASKRDITRNLSKLQIPAASANRTVAQLENMPVPNSPPQTTTTVSAHSVSSPILVNSKTAMDGKLTAISTPVQKYIVEDRQPNVVNIATTATTTPVISTSPTQQSSSTQYLPLSQISATNKLRAVNTTILSPGTKQSLLPPASAKKINSAPTSVISPSSSTPVASLLPDNISQFYNTLDPNNTNNLNVNLSQGNIPIVPPPTQQQQTVVPPSTGPTHAPPTVIQLHGNEVVKVGNQQITTTPTAQSKVITTKILPIVLGGGNNLGSTTNAIKTDPGNNNGAATSSTSIIKSLPPSSVFVANQHINSNILCSSSPLTNFGTSGQLFRKHPNILKSSSSSLGRNSSINNSGPQIISNIRLTPAITTGSNTNNTFTVNQTQSNIFQQQIRSASTSSAGIRTNVKICQSPNGKVFIQPANVDASKISKFSTGQLAQRILPGTLIGSGTNFSGNGGGTSSSNTTSNQPGSPHRIAIQKVQIIPAPIGGMGASQTQQQRLNLVAPKSNIGSNIFFSSATNPRSSGAITLGKDNSISALLRNIGSKQQQQSDILTKTPNVVVIDAAAAAAAGAATGNKLLTQQSNISRLSTNTSGKSSENCQMITEDTPVDIIVDNSTSFPLTGSTSTISSNESSSITAVLTSNLIERNQQSSKLQSEPSSTMAPVAVLSATDWEMELDQATAANALQHQQSGVNSTIKTKGISNENQLKLQQQELLSEPLAADTIIIDDSFEDVIIEEEEDREDIAAINDDIIVLDNSITADEITDKDDIVVDTTENFDTEAKQDMDEIQIDGETTADKEEDDIYVSSENEDFEGHCKEIEDSNNQLYEISPSDIQSSLSHYGTAMNTNQDNLKDKLTMEDSLNETALSSVSDSLLSVNVYQASNAQSMKSESISKSINNLEDSEKVSNNETESIHMEINQ